MYQLYSFVLDSKNIPFRLQDLSIYRHFKLIFSSHPSNKIVLHYHWFEFQTWYALFGMCWKVFCIWLFKKKGGHIVWTIHNRVPHDRKYLRGNIMVRKWMARKSDIITIHCNEAAQELSELLDIPRSKFRTVHHPMFPVGQMDPSEARGTLTAQLPINIPPKEPLFLMYGSIAAYKKPIEIIKIFKNRSINGHLLIAGHIKPNSKNYGKKLLKLASSCERCTVLDQFLTDEETTLLFSAANYSLINNREMYASGVAWLSASYGVPIIAPQKGCLHLLQSSSKITFFSSSKDLTAILQELTHNGTTSL